MSLSHLAKVELQTIMHGLDPTSLLRLACCSRITLAAASEAFSWRHLPLLTFDIDDIPDMGTRLQSTPLLRHSGVKLVSHHNGSPAAEQRRERLLQQLAIMSRVRVLHLGEGQTPLFDAAGWTRFFSLPTVRGLTDLRTGTLEASNVAPVLQQLVTHIPHLTSLDTSIIFRNDNAALLPQLTRLTHLSIDCRWAGLASGVGRIGECASLRSLTFRSVAGPVLTHILTSPGLQQLHTLRLDGMYAQGSRDGSKVAPDWAACFAYLPLLTSLTLVRCYGVDPMLCAISLHAPHIQSLLLIPSEDSIALDEYNIAEYAEICEDLEYGHELPSIDALACLARTGSSMHITIHLPPLSHILAARDDISRCVAHPWRLLSEVTERGLDADWWQRMRSALPLSLTSNRFTIVLKDG